MNTSLKKLNLRPFKLYRVYLKPHNSPNEGEFSWSWILSDFIHVQLEKGQFVIVCPNPPQIVALGGFTSVVVQWTSKKYTKKRDARAEQLFSYKTNCLLSLSLLSTPLLLKFPNYFFVFTGGSKHLGIIECGHTFERRHEHTSDRE